MSEFLYNFIHDKDAVESIIEMQRYIENQDVCEKINNQLNKWSINYDGDIFLNDRGNFLEFNKIFWMTNYMIYYKKITKEIKINVLTKIILFIQRNQSLYSNNKLLNLILHFEDDLYYEIKNHIVVMKKNSKPDLKIDEKTVALSQEIIKNFQSYNAEKNIYSFMNRKYDYKDGLNSILDLFERLYFISVRDEEFLKEEIIKNPKNGYNRRFFFILLYCYFNGENEKIYLDKFKIDEYRYSTAYIFIKMSKIKDEKEFIEFIECESIRLEHYEWRLNLLLEYINIYKYYNPNLILNDDNAVIQEVLIFRIKNDNKPIRHSKMSLHEFEQDDIPKRYDSIRVSTNGGFQDAVHNRFIKQTLLQKVLYILDMFLFVNEREFSNFGSLYQILGYIDDFSRFRTELKNIEWNSSEVIENIVIFEFEENWVSKIKELISLFGTFLDNYEKAKKINTNLKKFVEKYNEVGPRYSFNVSALTDFDSCFSKIEFAKDDIFILSLINVDFWNTIENIFYSLDEDVDFDLIFNNYNSMLREIKKNDLTNSDLIRINLPQKIKEYEILTLEISEDNLWIARRNIIFKTKEKFLYYNFINNVSLEAKRDFVILLLNRILNYNYTAWIKSVLHLDKIFGVKNMFDYIYKNKIGLMKLKKDDLRKRAEDVYSFAFWLDENSIQRNIFLFLLAVTFHDYGISEFDEKAVKIIKVHVVNRTNDNEIIEIMNRFYWNMYAQFYADKIEATRNFEQISKYKEMIFCLIKKHIYVNGKENINNTEYAHISSYSLGGPEISTIVNKGKTPFSEKYFDSQRKAIKKVYLFNTMAIFYNDRDDDRNDSDSPPKIIKRAISLIGDLTNDKRNNLLKTEETFGEFVEKIKDNYNYIKSFDIE
jgi:hypothetical protein